MIDTVNTFFKRIKRIPQASQIKSAMHREESTQAKALADAAAANDKATKAVAALEEQAIKALTGESQLDLGISSSSCRSRRPPSKRPARNTNGF